MAQSEAAATVTADRATGIISTAGGDDDDDDDVLSAFESISSAEDDEDEEADDLVAVSSSDSVAHGVNFFLRSLLFALTLDGLRITLLVTRRKLKKPKYVVK